MPFPTDAHDQVILTRLRAGDTRALECLIDRHAQQMRNVALLVLRRADLAEDVVQNIFINVWERRTTLEISGSFAGYLYRATRYLALKTVRHEDAEARAYRIAREVAPADAANTGATAFDARELAARIEQVLDTLQPQVRDIFLMRRLHAMSYENIAATLGITVVSARSQMSRAIRQLGVSLKDWP